MSAPWSDAPLFYVLAHIQFNAIPVMAKYAPEIADRLRKTGYPDFQEDHQTVMSFEMTAGGSPKSEQKEMPRWRLSNREKTSSFLLLTDALIYQTTQYGGREAFFDELRKGLEVVHECVQLDFVERIGLRYLDAVIPDTDAGENLNEYLIPEALGLGRNLQEGLQHSLVETVAKLPQGTLASRAFTTMWQGDRPPIPADLLPLPLVLAPRFSQFNGLVTILDNDCFRQNRIAFSVSEIIAILHELREGISLIFNSSVTLFAKEKWK